MTLASPYYSHQRQHRQHHHLAHVLIELLLVGAAGILLNSLTRQGVSFLALLGLLTLWALGL